MATKPVLPSRALVTGEVRLAFPSLFVLRPRMKGSDKLTYQAVLLLPPTADLTPYSNAIKAEMINSWGKLMPVPVERLPIKNCEEKAGTKGYQEGWRYINVHSTRPIGVVDQRGAPIVPDTDEDPKLPGRYRQSNRIFAGCWVKAYINAFCSEFTPGMKRVSFGLNAVQLVREDERLDGHLDTSAIFEPLEGSDEAPPSQGDDLGGMFK